MMTPPVTTTHVVASERAAPAAVMDARCEATLRMREAAYRRLVLVILGMDVATLAADLRRDRLARPGSDGYSTPARAA
jgi:hypothetical protein